MRKLVVDASVAVKWVVPEAHSEAALRMLTDGVALCAPGHWLAEVGTTLWAKSAVKGVLTRQQVDARIEWLGELAVEETPVRTLMPTAAAAAFELHATLYDTLYLALAERIAAPVVTADRTLLDKARASQRFAHLVAWVEDVRV